MLRITAIAIIVLSAGRAVAAPSLPDQLAAETAARQQGDTAIGQQLGAEEVARQQADNAIVQQLTSRLYFTTLPGGKLPQGTARLVLPPGSYFVEASVVFRNSSEITANVSCGLFTAVYGAFALENSIAHPEDYRHFALTGVVKVPFEMAVELACKAEGPTPEYMYLFGNLSALSVGTIIEQ